VSQELLYTSTPTGLKSGSRGFSTVLCTAGMASNISTRLEALSGYRHVFAPQDPQASLNPVSWSHLRLTINGQPTSILSRTTAYGVDYSGRTNKLAHHVVPSPTELAQAGPAWLLLQSSWVRTDWDGSCQTPASGPALPSGSQPVAICQRWQQTTGDAGWGGVLAETIASPASKPLWIVFSIDQSTQLLSLINESIALLPISQRWRATFSTYYTNLPPEIDCKIRCVLVGTEEAKLAPARGAVIDLTKTLAIPPSSAYVETARTGVAAKAKAPMPVAPGSTLTSPSSPSPEAIDGDNFWPNELLLQPPAVLGKSPALANKPSLPPQLPSGGLNGGGEEGRRRRIGWAIGISALSIALLLSAAVPIIFEINKRAAAQAAVAQADLAAVKKEIDELRKSLEQETADLKKKLADAEADKENSDSKSVDALKKSEDALEKSEDALKKSEDALKKSEDALKKSEDALKKLAEMQSPQTDAPAAQAQVPSPPPTPASTQTVERDDTRPVIIDDFALNDLIETKKIVFGFEKKGVSKIRSFIFRQPPEPTAQSDYSRKALDLANKTMISNSNGNEVKVKYEPDDSVKPTGTLAFTIDITKNEAAAKLISNVKSLDSYLNDCGSLIAFVYRNKHVTGMLNKNFSNKDAIRDPKEFKRLVQESIARLKQRSLEPTKPNELSDVNDWLEKASKLESDDLKSRLEEIKKEILKIPVINLGKVDFFKPAAELVLGEIQPELSLPLLFKLEIKE